MDAMLSKGSQILNWNSSPKLGKDSPASRSAATMPRPPRANATGMPARSEVRRNNTDPASPVSSTARKEALSRRRSSDLLYLTNPNVRKGAAGGDKEEGSNFEVYTQTFELSDVVDDKVRRVSMIRRRVTLLAEPVRHRRTYRTAPDSFPPFGRLHAAVGVNQQNITPELLPCLDYDDIEGADDGAEEVSPHEPIEEASAAETPVEQAEEAEQAEQAEQAPAASNTTVDVDSSGEGGGTADGSEDGGTVGGGGGSGLSVGKSSLARASSGTGGTFSSLAAAPKTKPKRSVGFGIVDDEPEKEKRGGGVRFANPDGDGDGDGKKVSIVDALATRRKSRAVINMEASRRSTVVFTKRYSEMARSVAELSADDPAKIRQLMYEDVSSDEEEDDKGDDDQEETDAEQGDGQAKERADRQSTSGSETQRLTKVANEQVALTQVINHVTRRKTLNPPKSLSFSPDEPEAAGQGQGQGQGQSQRQGQVQGEQVRDELRERLSMNPKGSMSSDFYPDDEEDKEDDNEEPELYQNNYVKDAGNNPKNIEKIGAGPSVFFPSEPAEQVLSPNTIEAPLAADTGLTKVATIDREAVAEEKAREEAGAQAEAQAEAQGQAEAQVQVEVNVPTITPLCAAEPAAVSDAAVPIMEPTTAKEAAPTPAPTVVRAPPPVPSSDHTDDMKSAIKARTARTLGMLNEERPVPSKRASTSGSISSDNRMPRLLELQQQTKRRSSVEDGATFAARERQGSTPSARRKTAGTIPNLADREGAVASGGSEVEEDGQKIRSYEYLVAQKDIRSSIDVTSKEQYLDDSEFEVIFGMSRSNFEAMPAWRRTAKKKAVGLF